jgi:UDP-glucose 4-epimerase
VIRALGEEPQVSSIVGAARREPEWQAEKTSWVAADVVHDDLDPLVRDSDVVVHLAWRFQPTHEPYTTWETNVIGTARLLESLARTERTALVYASSVGAYSPKDDDEPVDESWPTHGWPSAAYGREKAYVERLIDAYVAAHPDRRVVIMRPAFILQISAASQQRRLFVGPLLPGRLVRQGLVPVLPWPRGLRFQAVHADDAADAYRRAVVEPVRGTFNLAAGPVVTGQRVADLFGARLLDVRPTLIHASMAGAWRARMVPAAPELFEMALRLPVMDSRRATAELRWTPRHSALDAVQALLDGLRRGSGGPTPPLAA